MNHEEHEGHEIMGAEKKMDHEIHEGHEIMNQKSVS